MRVAVFSTKPYVEQYLRAANEGQPHDLVFLEPRLTRDTAALSAGCEAVCAFVNDDLDAAVLSRLANSKVRLVALRSAGFNHVDLAAAARLGLGLVAARVPGYSPRAVAEHCVGLILALNRKIHRAYNRVRENNFSITGLLGFDLYSKTVGVVGTGKIGYLGLDVQLRLHVPAHSDERLLITALGGVDGAGQLVWAARRRSCLGHHGGPSARGPAR